MTRKRYYIASNSEVSRVDILLAKQAPYDRLETAIFDMGGGVVFTDDGSIVMFHERHADMLERSGSARMRNMATEATYRIGTDVLPDGRIRATARGSKSNRMICGFVNDHIDAARVLAEKLSKQRFDHVELVSESPDGSKADFRIILSD